MKSFDTKQTPIAVYKMPMMAEKALSKPYDNKYKTIIQMNIIYINIIF